MIIGTITLITMLFFGGIQEYFFVEKLEKGVKQFITDKERSKGILTELKNHKKEIDAFNKDRKTRLKEFHTLNLDRDVSYSTLEEFFERRMKERLAFQENLVDGRIMLIEKITDEEWDQIINLSDETIEKKAAKEEKKNPKDFFKPVVTTVEKSIKEDHRMVQATALVQNFQTRYEELNSRINAINTRENTLLREKNTSKSQFQALAKEVNDVRAITYRALIDFHFDMLDVTEENEWLSIMKAMNKVLQ